jgi:hypothetical protein
MSNHVEHNGSGFVDPTVDGVFKKAYNERERAKEDYEYRHMQKDIKAILEANSYVLEGPISLINVESGRKRRIY